MVRSTSCFSLGRSNYERSLEVNRLKCVVDEDVFDEKRHDKNNIDATDFKVFYKVQDL